MEFRTYRITTDDSGRRVDRVVRRFLPGLSLSGIYKLLRKGLIRVDGTRVPQDFHVREGSELGIAACLPDDMRENGTEGGTPEPANARQNGFRPDILLETADLLFINKPCGIPVHGEGGLDRLIPSSERADQSLSFRTGPLHRIDRDTTGIIAFSRSLDGARWFSSSVSDHVFEKYYLGIARGPMAGEEEWRDKTDDGKEMITLACPLAVSDPAPGRGTLSLVRYRIITGRKHQIRLQGKRHGFPLAGDKLYDDSKAPAPGHTYFLHAWQLVFGETRLPGIPEKLRAPLPEPFRRTVQELFGAAALARIDDGDINWRKA